jgi:BirA family biotin operon repressor/biotin-[acetyl-CoA-carboxylase] ligase
VPAELAAAIEARRDRLGVIGRSVLFFESVGSTNDVAASLAVDEGSEGTVVIADAQTAGRGRRGRGWYRPAGAGVGVSIVGRPGRAHSSPERATALLTLAAGVALAEAVDRITGLRPAIKWPNDLIVGGRKLAGILAEGVTAPALGSLRAVVLGYGINVREAAYPPELANRVTALEPELGRSIDRAALCAETLASVAARYDDLLAARFDAILDAWRRHAAGMRGAAVEWDTPSGVRTGIAEDIDDTGALIVRSGTAIERLVAGEVRWTFHAASH